MASSVKQFADFTSPPAPKEQAIALIYGRPGEGKSTLGLSGAPGPIAFFDIDRRGLHAAAAAQEKGKRVHYVAIDFPTKLTKMTDVEAKAAGQKSWDKFVKNYEAALEASNRGDVRTVVIDTASELCEILKISVQGRVDKKSDDYGKSKGIINAEMAKTIKMSRNSSANLILLARAKQVWEDNKPIDRWDHVGLDCLSYDADWVGHLRLKKMNAKRKTEPEFEMQIMKAGVNLEEQWAVYDAADWGEYGPFVWSCVMQYQGSDPTTWE